MGAVMRLEDEERMAILPRVLMLLAGPASSLLLAWLSLRLTVSGALDGKHGQMLFFSSLSIVLVNLLPVMPLDGGRLLHLLISRLFSDTTAAKIMQVLGSLIGTALIVLNVLVSFRWGGWNLSLACAGCCILYGTAAARTTAALHELQAMMERKIRLERRGILPGRLYCVMGNAGLQEALRYGRGRRQTFFCVIQPGTMAVLGWLYEQNAITIYLDHPEITVAEALFLYQNNL